MNYKEVEKILSIGDVREYIVIYVNLCILMYIYVYLRNILNKSLLLKKYVQIQIDDTETDQRIN